MPHGAGIVVLLVLALACAGGLVSTAGRARSAQGRPRGGGGRGGGWLAHRRALRLERVRHANASARDNAKHEHRLAEQKAAAEASAAGGAGGDGGRHSKGGTVQGTVVRRGVEPATGAGASAAKPKPGDPPAAPPAGSAPKPSGPSGSPGTPGTPGPSPSAAPGGTPPQPAAPARAASPQQSPAQAGSDHRPEPGQSQSPTLEGVVMTDNPAALSVPGVEQIIDGANAVRRYMLSGNARAKQRGLLGIGAAEDALARTIRALARDMAEPGQHYGPEITDPLAMSATHLVAASMALAEIQGRLRAIIRASEELAAAGVQAPHHSEFAEDGSGPLNTHNGGYARTAPPNTYVEVGAPQRKA